MNPGLCTDAHPPAIFIHGISQRSGTNYLRWVLACHRDVEASPQAIWEFPHLSSARPLRAYADAMAASPKLAGVGRSEILAALGGGLLRLAHHGLDGRNAVLLKEPSVRGIETFFDYFPQARLIILVRDGRDVSGSLARTSFGDLPSRWYRRLVRRVQGSTGLRATHAEAWAAASREIVRATSRDESCWREQCTVIRYEDLVGSFDATVEALLARLGLEAGGFDWDAARSLAIKGSSFVGCGDPRQGLDWQGVDKAGVDFVPTGRWQEWPVAEQRRYLHHARSELEYWGYSTK